MYPARFPFHALALAGNVDGFRHLLAPVTDTAQVSAIINEVDHRGFTVLHRAAEGGHVDMIEMLLQMGAEVSAAVAGHDPRGWTPLHLAAFDDHPEAIRTLIAAGADVRAIAEDPGFRGSALRVAVTRGSADAVDALLEAGADPFEEDDNGFTLLHEAANVESPRIVGRLLEAGCSLIAEAQDGSTPVDWAVMRGNEEIQQIMRNHLGC